MPLEAALTKDLWVYVLCCPPEGLSPRCHRVSFLAKVPFTCWLPFPASLPQCPTGISWDYFPRKQLAVEFLPQGHLQIKYLHLNPCMRIYFQRMQTKTHIGSLLQSPRVCYYSLFTEEECEAQRGQFTCTRSHSWRVAKPNVDKEPSDPKPVIAPF